MTKQSNWLQEKAFNIRSQFGEDGILEAALQCLPQRDCWCVEFGAWDGEQYSNTWNLINNHGYKAVLIEADANKFSQLVEKNKQHKSVYCLNAMVEFEGPNTLDQHLSTIPIPLDFDFLSIDVDAVDYHIFDSMNNYRPKLIIIEINPTIPPGIEYVQPRDKTIYHGTSITSMVNLAKSKNYELIATTDCNALFVDDRYFPLFDIEDNRPEILYDNREYTTVLFQLFDGTLKLSGCKELLWHDIPIDEEAIQPLPRDQRRYVAALPVEGGALQVVGSPDPTHDAIFIESGLWTPPDDLRLHLGCGENHLEGYVNIDYPATHHNLMRPKADFSADILKLVFSDGVVSEIRLHHVFEHFNRVTALAMLIQWHRWLKIGGTIRIETPDIIGSAKMLLADVSPLTRMGIVRHLAGDQSSAWGYHVDHWFPERLEHTLALLGFGEVRCLTAQWEQEPYLSNVEAWGVKKEHRSIEEQLGFADELLWESTVADAEKATHEVWRRQLRDLFGVPYEPGFVSARGGRKAGPGPVREKPHGTPGIQSPSFDLIKLLAQGASSLPIEEIHDFNQRDRDRWVGSKARSLAPGSRVLDVGAGTCLYREEFAHCIYETQDFMQYDGYRDEREGTYGRIDHVSDIKTIPVPSESFDAVLCTEVLEHVPEPIEALREMVRILKPGGRLFLTAPLGSGLHQLPYHFYGGFTPAWYRHFCGEFGLTIREIEANGGFFKLLAQECARVAWTMERHEHLHGESRHAVEELFGTLLPRFLFALDERCFIDQFTVGYHVEAVK